MKLNTKGFGVIPVILIIVLVGALGFTGYRAYTAQTDNSKTAPKQHSNDLEVTKNETQGTVIKTGDSKFGTVLFDGKGRAIYIWELEESTKAECYEDCAVVWPPVFTDGTPSAAGGVNNELLGTTKRNDGSTQVTYNGHPLYYYAHEGVGEVKCHNVSTHGGLWWVIQPSGIRAD